MSEEEFGAAEEQSMNTENLSGNEGAQAQEGAAESAVEEKLIPQSQVNKLVGLRAQQAEQRAEAKWKQREAELLASQNHSAAPPSDPIEALMAQIETKISTSVDQRVANLRAQQNDAIIAKDFQQKIDAAFTDDPDFAEAFQDLNLKPESSGIDAEIIRMSSKLDNTAAVLKELGQNPGKFSDLRGFLREENTRMAQKTLLIISESISRNDAARKSKPAPAPLNQLKPSNLGVGGGKVKSLDQMKAFFS